MFRNTFHETRFLSILYTLGTHPLQLWKQLSGDGGRIELTTDSIIESKVLSIEGDPISDNYITTPPNSKKMLGIKLPYLVFLIKNIEEKYFSFEVEVLDDKNVRRRLRASNYQSTPRVKPYICTMPLSMQSGWNQVTLDLPDLLKKAYGSTYKETLRVTIHSNCMLRAIYFSNKLCSEEELPPEFKLFQPVKI